MVGELKRIWQDTSTKELVSAEGPKEGLKRTDLVYDAQTKIVYYKCSGRRNEGFMSPYIGPNGKFCRFDGLFGGRIVEVK